MAAIAATAALGGLLFGYNTGIIAGTFLFFQASFQLSSLMLVVVTNIALAGAAVGAAFVGMLADRFGRRTALIGTALVFIVGTAASALALNVIDLLGVAAAKTLDGALALARLAMEDVGK
jgi:MFS family permease